MSLGERFNLSHGDPAAAERSIDGLKVSGPRIVWMA
jgi:hypothetical protein